MFAPVRVVLGRTQVSLDEVINLQVGDILRLDIGIKEDVVVFGGARPKFLGPPGLSGKRRAVQLTQPILKTDEINYMTEVQKTEAEEL